MELVISLDEKDMDELRTGGRVFIKMNPKRNYDNLQMIVVKTDAAVYPIVEKVGEGVEDDDISLKLVDVICENCKGTGFVQIAPNPRGIKRCDVCGGMGTTTRVEEEV